RAAVILLQHDHRPGIEKGADRREEVAVQVPAGVVLLDLPGPLVREMRRGGDHQIPTPRGREGAGGGRGGGRGAGPPPGGWGGVGDRGGALERLGGVWATGGVDCLAVDVGKAQALAQAMPEEGEADEAGPRTPFERPPLFRHSPPAQGRNEILPERAAATIEM